MSQLTPFLFENETLVRAIKIDGEVWFVAKDVAIILGYTNTRKAVTDHCKAGRPIGTYPNEGVTNRDPLDPQTVIIPERDVYRLIMRSKLPAAERFEEWVVGEVIPTIRKTGGYGTPSEGSADPLGRDLVEVLTHAVTAQRTMVAREHRAHFTRILIAETSLSDQEIAARLADILGGDMPEYVAWQRRKLAEGRP